MNNYFQIDIIMYTEMDQTFTEIRLRQNLHNSVEEWEEAYKRWTSMEFNKLVVNELVDLTMKTIKNCTQFEKYLPVNDILPELKKSAEDFKLKLPVIGYLRNNNFRAVATFILRLTKIYEINLFPSTSVIGPILKLYWVVSSIKKKIFSYLPMKNRMLLMKI